MENFDFFLPMEIPFKIFKVSGLWQDKKATKAYKLFGFIMHLVGIEIFALGQLIYMIYAESVADISDAISILLTYVGLSFKSLILIIKFDNVVGLIEELKVLISLIQAIDGKPLKCLRTRVIQIRTVFRIFWGSCLVATVLGGIVPLATYIANPNPPFQIAYKFWTPFDYQNNVYWFAFIATVQAINPVFFSSVVTALEIFSVFCFNAAAGLIEELTERFNQIGNEMKGSEGDDTKANEENVKKLETYIKLHIRIKRFIVKAEDIFSAMIFAQAAISLIVLCTSVFNLSKIPPLAETSKFLRLLSYVVPMVLQIFIPCFYGTEISIASEKLSTSLFHAEWFGENKKFKSAMKMFMENTKRQIKVTSADGAFHVNLGTFLGILNLAYSMYALLQRIN